MTELEKGYIAGIIDGEGTISLLRHDSRSKFRTLTIEVTSTTYAILEKMKEVSGGGVISKITKKVEHHKQAYKWSLTYDKVLSLLEEIQDYLLEPKKKARAKFLIENYKKVTIRNGRYNQEQLKAKIKFEEDFFKLEEE